MAPLELVAVALGIVNIVLLVRRSIWNYPFGIAMVTLYAVIFRDARLYSDMLLQGFFFVVQAWGWWAWARVGGMDGPVAVSRLRGRDRWFWLAGVAATALVWGTIVGRWTNAAQPYWDAAVAMGSIAAQILLVQRRIENWIGWIAVDVLAIGLYANRALWLTAALYVLFLGLSAVGLAQWHRAERAA